MLERIVDLAARELGDGPDRAAPARTSSSPSSSRYKIPGGNEYDSGDYEAVLDKALELADLPHWRARAGACSRKEGRYIGIGLVTCQERSVYAANEWWFFDRGKGIFVSSVPESITLSVDATGGITATLYSTAFWGNSPETVVAQCVAEELGVEPGRREHRLRGNADRAPGQRPGRQQIHRHDRRRRSGRRATDP